MLMTPVLLCCCLLLAGADDAPQGLAEPIVDGTYGYSIRPPSGWQVSRQRQAEPRGFILGSRDVTLLRLFDVIQPGQAQQISLRQCAAPRKATMAEVFRDVSAALHLEFNDVRILAQQTQEIAGRPGGVLAAAFKTGGVDSIHIQAIVEIAPAQYYVLSYEAPAAHRDRGEALFHQVVAGFQVLGEIADKDRVRADVERASAWLKSITAEALGRAVLPESYLLIEDGGKPVGFVGMKQSSVVRAEGGAGIELHERGWYFNGEGGARRSDLLMFISKNREHETWKNIVATLSPAQTGRPQRLDIAEEEGLRRRDTLLTSQCYEVGRSPSSNPPLQLPESYIPRGIIRMYPRLVGSLEQPRRMVFGHFDHTRAGLVLLVEEIKGAVEPPADIAAGDKVYLIEEREGLAGVPSKIYVNAEGEVLFARVGDMTMKRTTQAELERLFLSRVRSAERTMEEHVKMYEQEQARLERNLKPSKPAAHGG